MGVSPGLAPGPKDRPASVRSVLFHALKVRSPHIVLRTKGHIALCCTTPQKLITIAPCCTKPQKVRSPHVALRLKGQTALCCTQPQRSNRPMYPAPKVRSPYVVPRLKGKLAPCSTTPQKVRSPMLYDAPNVSWSGVRPMNHIHTLSTTKVKSESQTDKRCSL